MDRGGAVADEEELALRRCPILFAPSAPVLAREGHLARLAEQLDRDRFAVVRAVSHDLGPGLAAEYAHARRGDYPGGAVWIRHVGSTPKEPAADVVEALGLPTSCWLHWPFVDKASAMATMWRGLGARLRTLVVIDGWPPWGSILDWNPSHGTAHVIAIADPATEVPEANVLAIDAGAALSSGESAATEALSGLSEQARKLVTIASCLGPQPLLPSVLRAIWTRVPGSDAGELSSLIQELVVHGLVRCSVLGEIVGDPRTLTTVRGQSDHSTPLWEPIVAGLVEQLDLLEATYVHKARSVVAVPMPSTFAIRGRRAIPAPRRTPRYHEPRERRFALFRFAPRRQSDRRRGAR